MDKKLGLNLESKSAANPMSHHCLKSMNKITDIQDDHQGSILPKKLNQLMDSKIGDQKKILEPAMIMSQD